MQQSPSKTTPLAQHGGPLFKFWTLPHAFWVAGVFSIGLLFLAAISFAVVKNYTLVFSLDLTNYSRIVTSGRYLDSIRASCQLSILVAAISIVLGFITSFVLNELLPRSLNSALLVSLLAPFFANSVLRAFAWQPVILWLGGLFSRVEILSGSFSLFTQSSIALGLISVSSSLTTLLLYLAYIQLDPDWADAAINLGASRIQILWLIELPHLVPAAILGGVLSMVFTMSDFVYSSILGGNLQYLVSTAIQDRMKVADWPAAAALSIITCLLMTLVFWLGLYLSRAGAGRLGTGVNDGGVG